MTSLRTVAVNASWLVSDRLVRLGVSFFVGILIARHLGPEGFGLLSFGQVLVTLLLPLATFGMPDILVREFAKGQRDPALILATALRLRLALAVLTIAAMLLAGVALRGRDVAAAIVVLAYGLSFLPQAFDVIESRFQSLNRMGVLSTVRMINTVAFGAIKLAALAIGVGVEGFAALYSLEILSFAALSIIAARRRHVALGLTAWDRDEAADLLRASTPLMLRLATIGIYMRIDQLLVSHLLGDADLGIYSISVRISELWYFVPTAIVTAALPDLTRRYEQSPADYAAGLRRLLQVMVVISVPTAAALSLAARPLILLLLGPAYLAAAPVLAIHAWAGVFVAIGVAAGPWFINTGQLRYGLFQAAAGAVVSVGLNLVLIPRFGLIGAAASLVISYSVSAIVLNAIFRATRGLFVMQIKAFVLR